MSNKLCGNKKTLAQRMISANSILTNSLRGFHEPNLRKPNPHQQAQVTKKLIQTLMPLWSTDSGYQENPLKWISNTVSSHWRLGIVLWEDFSVRTHAQLQQHCFRVHITFDHDPKTVQWNVYGLTDDACSRGDEPLKLQKLLLLRKGFIWMLHLNAAP